MTVRPSLPPPGILLGMLRRRGIRPTRRLGQHYLIDEALLDRIADAAGADSETLAVEVGAGPLTLTSLLAARAGYVLGIEYDTRLDEFHRTVLAGAETVRIVYEDALRVRQKLEVEQALLLQISMVHWRMLGKPDAAEPYFARLRKLDPAHLAVIEFYREFCDGEERAEVLMDVLTDAQRVSQDPELKRTLAVEIAQRAQAVPGMTERSIDAWKMVLRVDPGHAEASSILKELYAKSSKWNALVEVLRNEIDAVPSDEVERKVALLRELSTVYRDYLRMDGMIVSRA